MFPKGALSMTQFSRVVFSCCIFCLVIVFASVNDECSGKNKPDPLAPLVQPEAKRDFWVGTITIKKKKDVQHHRAGKATIAHANMKGDGHFSQHDEDHTFYTATITIEPCPDRSACWSRTSGTVNYTMNNMHHVERTQPIVCRGKGDSLISDEDNRKQSGSGNGTVKSSASVIWMDDGWHIQANVYGNDLVCPTVIEESSTRNPGCGAKPVPDNPKPKNDSIQIGGIEERFYTGISDAGVTRLDDTKSIEHTNKPDPENDPKGTISIDHTVTYHLRRIQEY
jgi:hypothetical protein